MPVSFKLQTKIIISFSVLVIIIITILGFFLNNSLFRNIEDRITDNMIQLSIKISQHVDSYITGIDQVSKNIIVNKTLTDTLSSVAKQDAEIDSYTRLKYTRGLEETMSKTIAISSIPLPYVYVFSSNNKYKYVYNPMSSNFELISKNADYMNKLDSREMVIYPENRNSEPYNGVDSFSLIRAVFDLSGIMYGYVEVQQNYTELQKICDIGNTGDVYIIDKQNNIIFPPDKVNPADKYFILNSKPENGSGILKDKAGNLYSYNKSNYTDFTVFIKHSEKSVFAPLYLVKSSTYAVILIVTILSLLIIYFISRLLVHPIRVLRDNVVKVSYSNMEIKSNKKIYNNEVILLNNAFQDMLDRLKESMEREIILNKEEAKARFTALQAQIAPHFIHNVLYIISIFAQENKTTDVIRMCKQLSNMLRYVVDSPSETVKLDKEISYTSDYLSLQKKNYEDFLNYEIVVQEETKNIYLPRLVIQPFVENAIHHGFKDRRPPWNIFIRCMIENGIWCILIEDNGSGMSSDELEDINNKISGIDMVYCKLKVTDEPGMCSMGILNTVMRLNLMYKGSLDFKIFRNEYGGITVSIKGKVD